MSVSRTSCLLALLLLLPLAAWGVIETYSFSSAELEARDHSLSQELRCPKCQNQNIADSNAPIARDLRVVLYEQLEAGASDDEILAFMVARYGEFVRYRPSLDPNTVLLWVSPAVLLLAGALGLVWHLKGRRVSSPAPLTSQEREKLERLMAQTSGEADP